MIYTKKKKKNVSKKWQHARRHARAGGTVTCRRRQRRSIRINGLWWADSFTSTYILYLILCMNDVIL